MTETWLPIPGFNGYEVSDHGRVRTWIYRSRRLDVPRIKPQSKSTGKAYFKVSLGGANLLVHRLVLLAFVGPVPDGHEVCHSNGNADDNGLSNLRYGTKASNEEDKAAHGTTQRGERCGRHKLTAAQVLDIRRRYDAGERSCLRLSESYGVSERAVHSIVTRRTWYWLIPESVTVP